MGDILHTFSFKDGFKKARKEHGYTQQSFADDFNVSIETIKNWEQGRNVPELDTIKKLCKKFECNMDYLFNNISCKTHDIQFIQNTTGLSESSVEKLNHFTTFERGNERLTVINYLLNDENFTYFLTDNILQYYNKYVDYQNGLIQYNDEQIQNPIDLKKKFDSGELKPSIMRNKLNEYKNSMDATQFIIQNDMREITTSLVEYFYNKNHKMG